MLIMFVKKFNKGLDIIIGTVGRLYYQKDPITLIKSFKILNDKFPNTKLIMVGEGPLENVCIKLIDKLGLNNKIDLVGYQKNSKIYYQKFDIFMLSSHYEGLPYALLEAMSMGIPSVGTNVVGIKDLISNGRTGYFAEEEDFNGLATSVINLLNNPDLLSEFSENAKKISRMSFNFNNGIKEYQEFYSSLGLGTI